MSEQTTGRRFLLLIVAILIVIIAGDTVGVLRMTNNHDFAVYYRAAERLRSGQDIYAELGAFRTFIESGQSTKDEDTPWPFSTPPFHALLTVPLTLLPYSWAAMIWTGLCLAAMAVACWLLLRSQHWLTLSGLAVTLLLLDQFQPAVVAVRLGQIDMVIFLLLVLAFIWLKAGAETKAGLALGMAIGIKVFAGFLVLYLLWKRRRQAALVALTSGVVFLIGSFVMVGSQALKRYLEFSSLYTWGAFAGYPYHQSLNAFFTRTFKQNIFMSPVANLPWLADGLTIVLSVLLLVGLAWLTRRSADAPDAGHSMADITMPRFDLEYALTVTTMLLILPPAPRYAFVWLLLGFLVVAARLVRGEGPSWLIALLALSYILSARLVYFPLPLLRRLVMDGQFMLSALLLWLALAWLLWKSRQVKGEP